ncbi:MAG: hypothetical protein AAF989_05340, partial [Planctomycetota bacterium]
RCVAIASYRRRVVLGPLGKQNPLSMEALDSTKYPARLNEAIGKNLIGAMRAAERFGISDDARVLADNNRYGTFSNGVHPLSAVLMLCNTSAVAMSDDWVKAPAAARVTANVAAALDQPELVGEALQLAAGCSTRANAQTVEQFATQAASGLMRQSRLASLHCLIAAADAAVTAGNTTSATKLIRQAQSLSNRRDVVQPRLDAYGAFVSARLAAADGHSIGTDPPSRVDQPVESIRAFAFERKFRNRPVTAMPRVYQLNLIAEAAAKSGGVGLGADERIIKSYYDSVPSSVWRQDPVDALTASMLDKQSAMQSWLAMSVGESSGRSFLKRLDLVLANRFLRRLPLGGRVAQVRALASTGESLLSNDAKLFLKKGSATMTALRQSASQPVPADVASAMSQSKQQEAMAIQVALERQSIPRVTPVTGPDQDLADRLPSRTALLTFTQVGTRIVGTRTQAGQTDLWIVAGTKRLSSELNGLMQKVGVGVKRGKRLPEGNEWIKAAAAVRDRLLPESLDLDPTAIDHLVIVPDGMLWYLPFELLPLTDRDQLESLDEGELVETFGSVTEIRYAATPASAFTSNALPPINRSVAVAAGAFFAPRDVEANESVIESVMEALDDKRRISAGDAIPSGLIGDAAATLCVASARAMDLSQPFRFSVGSYDASSPMGSLRGWMRMPASSPRTVVLPGFRSAISNGQIGTGEELFFVIAALQAAGVRDIFISRWAVGGRSTGTLLKELLPEIPFAGLAGAWQRCRGVLRETEIDPTGEPLIPQAEHRREGVTGGAPLFWSGYMVVAPLDPSRIPKPAQP